MRQALQSRPAHLVQQLLERITRSHPSTQRQRIDEEPDQILRLHPRPVRHRHPDHHITLTRPPRQHRRQHRLQNTEKGGAALLGGLGQPGDGRGVECFGELGAPMTRRRGPRPVGRQIQSRRRTRQLMPPVGQLLLQHITGQPTTLPRRVIRVLHHQIRQLTPRIRRLNLPQQHPDRPTVRHDVMHRQRQNMLALTHPHHHHPHQRTGNQIERQTGKIPRSPQRHSIRITRTRHITHHELDRRLITHNLHRTRHTLDEPGPQHLVPPRHHHQRTTQTPHIQPTRQPHSRRNVVERPLRIQLMQKPHPLLSKRQRQLTTTIHPHQLRQRTHTPRRHHHPGQHPQHRALEQRPQRKLNTEVRTDTRNQLGGQQRVAAEREEVIVQTHPLHTQHLGEQLRQPALLPRHRRPIPHPRHRQVRGRKRRPVDLAVGGEGHGVEGGDVGGDEGFGEGGGECGAGLRREEGAGGVGGETGLVVGVGVGDDDGVRDAGQVAQGVLDLAELDALATDLDLVITPAQELQLPGGKVAGDVTGGVETRPGCGAEGVGDEGRRRAGGIVEVTAADAGAGDEEFTPDADGQGPEILVQDVETGVAHGAADRDVRVTGLRAWGEGGMGDVVGALGGTVGVDDVDPRITGEPPGAQIRRQRLPRDDEFPQHRQGGGGLLDGVPRVQSRPQERGNHFENGHGVPVRAQEQLRRVMRRLVPVDRGPPTGHQSGGHLPHRDVERQRRVLRDHITTGQTQIIHLRQQVIVHPRVMDHRPLRTPRRTRRIQHIRQIIAIQRTGADELLRCVGRSRADEDVGVGTGLRWRWRGSGLCGRLS
ncbi:Uncharacterised protein [Streptomyces griseus]|nr:Uncharacterised protein [Streptomyces griseus]